jgi:hypothetical protein
LSFSFFRIFVLFRFFISLFFNLFLVSLHISFLTFVFPLMKGYFWDPNYLPPVISDLGCFKIWLSNSYFYGVVSVWLILLSFDFNCLFFYQTLGNDGCVNMKTTSIKNITIKFTLRLDVWIFIFKLTLSIFFFSNIRKKKLFSRFINYSTNLESSVFSLYLNLERVKIIMTMNKYF